MQNLKIEISPDQVIRYWRKYKLQVSKSDAEKWLRRNAGQIRSYLQPDIDERLEVCIFPDGFTFGLPDPSADRVRQSLDDARCQAEDRFAQRLGLTFDGNTWKEEDENRAIIYFSKASRRKRMALLDYEFAFAKHEESETPRTEHNRLDSCHYDLVFSETKQGEFSAAIYERGEEPLKIRPAFGNITAPSRYVVVPSIRINERSATFIDHLRSSFSTVFGRERQPSDPIFYDTEHDVSHAPLPTTLQALSEQSGIPPELMYAANQFGRIVTESTAHLLTKDELDLWRRAIKEYHRLATASSS